MSFAERLIDLRKQKNLTQQALADATDMHVQQIKRYEAGSSEPSAEALRKIARAFSISTDSLLFEEGERSPSDDLALQFEAVSRLPESEKHIARTLLDAMIFKHRVNALTQTDVPAAKDKAAKKKPAATRNPARRAMKK